MSIFREFLIIFFCLKHAVLFHLKENSIEFKENCYSKYISIDYLPSTKELYIRNECESFLSDLNQTQKKPVYTANAYRKQNYIPLESKENLFEKEFIGLKKDPMTKYLGLIKLENTDILLFGYNNKTSQLIVYYYSIIHQKQDSLQFNISLSENIFAQGIEVEKGYAVFCLLEDDSVKCISLFYSNMLFQRNIEQKFLTVLNNCPKKSMFTLQRYKSITFVGCGTQDYKIKLINKGKVVSNKQIYIPQETLRDSVFTSFVMVDDLIMIYGSKSTNDLFSFFYLAHEINSDTKSFQAKNSNNIELPQRSEKENNLDVFSSDKYNSLQNLRKKLMLYKENQNIIRPKENLLEIPVKFYFRKLGEFCHENRPNSCTDWCRGNYYLIFGNICKNQCPIGYLKQLDKVCVINSTVIIPNEDAIREYKYMISVETVLSKDSFESQIENVHLLCRESGDKRKKIFLAYSKDFNYWCYPESLVNNIRKEKPEYLPENFPKIEFDKCKKILIENKKIEENTEIYFEVRTIPPNCLRGCSKATSKMSYKVYKQGYVEIPIDVCSNITMPVKLPIDPETSKVNLTLAKELLEQEIDIFNPDEDIFNDPCSSFSYEGKDLTLEDRKNYILSSESLCEDQCTLKKVDLEENTVDCECHPVKESSKEEIIESNEIYETVDLFLHETNINFFRCYKVPFKIETLKNPGHWTIFGLAALMVYGAVIFWNFHFVKIQGFLSSNMNSPPAKGSGRRMDIDSYKPSKDFISGSSSERAKMSEKNKHVGSKEIKIEISKENEEEEGEFIDEELNEMCYIDAKFDDHRTFGKYFLSILREKETLMSIILSKSILYPFSLQLFMISFTFSTFFFLTGLFFTEKYISQRYVAKNSSDFFYIIKKEMTKSVYASFVGVFVGKLIEAIFSINTSFTIAFRDLQGNERSKKISELYYQMKKRLTIVFIISFTCMLVYWYFLTIFCNLYKNNRLALFESTAITILFNLIVQALLCLFISILRIIGLRKESK